jgi:hypothetical protein
MHHATSDLSRQFGVALTLVLAVGMLPRSSPAAGLLDLTRKEPANSGALGVPGDSSDRSVPFITIPLQVTILNLWPSVLSSEGRINLDVLVRNVGKESILIPASKDYSHVIRAGNLDQRMMSVQLELRHPGTPTPLTIGIGASVGSTSIPDSMVRLAPQETMVIRVAENLSDTWKWHESGLSTDFVSAKVSIHEAFLENDRFFVKTWSERVTSVTAMTFTWGR